ncbi:sigma-70 family RNA polymerase sigma factor [Actinomadura terrae]|uniref:sigma-70 family RNA polymerase sigma factor n=1 Tax=Actinomadura terrae TaxID=604353 RepID=UPI001FA792CC|nr:sigma-70 family RNA polymerase sigma factor [Actinomadura terrae]
MDDPLLVEALRARDPNATAEVYDAYADRIYAYCWFQLHDMDAAQTVLCDTFVVAEAHIDRLRDADRFGAWLYAIARQECARRLPTRARPPDLPVAQHDQDDADQRIVAWQAVLALPPHAREVLELRVRHQLAVPDLAVVLDLPPKEAQTALDRAHEELEGALTAEILAHQGPYGCAERALLLRVRRGEPSTERGQRLLRHAEECEVCAAFRPRTVSAAKVFGVLPDVEPPADLRQRVLACFLDPELVGYRLFVANRAAEFTPSGFPAQPRQTAHVPSVSRPGRDASRPSRLHPERGTSERSAWGVRARRVALVVGVATVFFGGVLASANGFFGLLDWRPGRAGTAGGLRPDAGPGQKRAHAAAGAARPGTGRNGTIDAVPASVTSPLGSRGSSAPPIALFATPPRAVYEVSSGNWAHHPSATGANRRLDVAPHFLDLAGGSDGSIVLRATGRPVTWRARSWGGVRPSAVSGHLAPGQMATVDVHVARNAAAQGEGGVLFQPGGIPVHVTWRPSSPGSSVPGPASTSTSTSPDPVVPSSPSKSGGSSGSASSSDPKPPASPKPPKPEPAPSSGPPPSGGHSDSPQSPGPLPRPPIPPGLGPATR